MWFKYIIIVFLFYLLAILQNSFFVHFNLFGATPNLVFILFFLLVFFEKNNASYKIIFYALFAGLFSDFFLSTYFGASIIIFLLIGFSVKKIQTLLKERENNQFPLIYFLPLFLVFLVLHISLFEGFSPSLIPETAYNLFTAIIAFYAYKKLFAKYKI